MFIFYKLIKNYILNITQELNTKNIDLFERCYYNFIILLYCFFMYLIIIIKHIVKYIYEKILFGKIKIYDKIFGNIKFKLSTPNLFYKVLQDIPANSNIFDFGSGTSYKNKNTIDLIIKNNYKITGIDIDTFAINQFDKFIISQKLNKNINLLTENIFNLKFNNNFDYVIFSESAPLLNIDFINKLIIFIKENILKPKGKIIFINNLVENPQQIVNYIKPKLIYITSINFGKVMTKNDFIKISNINKMKINFKILDTMTIKEIATYFHILIIYRLFKKIGFKNYLVSQYEVVIE